MNEKSNWKKYLKHLSFSALFILLSAPTLAAPPQRTSLANSSAQALQKALGMVSQGSYSFALDILRETRHDYQSAFAFKYWKGYCEFKLQKFDLAAKTLDEVVRSPRGSDFKDAAYMLGQSLYASKKFKLARAAFQKSVEKDYKKDASLYYMGYSSVLLKEDSEAIKHFNQVLEIPGESDMKQPAAFQIGEIYFSQADQEKDPIKSKETFKTKTIPAYQRTISMNENGVLANQAKGRLSDVHKKIGTEIPKTANDTPVPKQAWVIRISEDVKYDSNVITQADNKLLKVAYTGSPYNKTALFGKYEMMPSNAFILTPELNTDYTFYWRRHFSNIYNNDAVNLSPAIRSRLDHKIEGTPASALFEYEYAYTFKDYNGIHRMLYYSNSNNFIIGERVNFFKTGSTTLKFSYKYSENHTVALNYVAPAVNLAQDFAIYKAYKLNASINIENQVAKASTNDQATYRIALASGIPDFIWKSSLDVNFTTTYTDTMNQSSTRGIEKTINPSLTWTKHFGKLSMNLNYAYTKNISDDTVNYAYTKHTVGIVGQYTF